ncbi:hypothetical protein GQ457_17G013590 [Hibiscus cannabinus]
MQRFRVFLSCKGREKRGFGVEERSFDKAVKGCNGGFHVAASMEFDANTNENIEHLIFQESYVRSNSIEPAIKCTKNPLKTCLKSNTVKMVVFTSSISTITAKDKNGNWRFFVDEYFQATFDHVLNAKASLCPLQVLIEEVACKFTNENGIDLVSVTTMIIVGPFLTTTIPSSIQVLMSLVTSYQQKSSDLF